MKLFIALLYIAIAVAQAAQGNYITAAALIALYIVNECISEQRYHKLMNQYKLAVASYHEDNVILSRTLSRTQMKLDAANQRNKQ